MRSRAATILLAVGGLLVGYWAGVLIERGGPRARPPAVGHDGAGPSVPPGSVVASRADGPTGPACYHRPDCGFVRRIAPANRVIYDSPAAAEAHGHRPCRRCRPASVTRSPDKRHAGFLLTGAGLLI